MERCLEYFRVIVFDHLLVPAWNLWWAKNEEIVKRESDSRNQLRLKYRKIEGARDLLVQLGECVKTLRLPGTIRPMKPGIVGFVVRSCFGSIPKRSSKKLMNSEMYLALRVHKNMDPLRSYCPNDRVKVLHNIGTISKRLFAD